MFVSLEGDADGPLPEALDALPHDAPGALRLPAAQLPEPHRPLPEARRAGAGGGGARRAAAGRGQPLWRPVVRRAAAAAAGRALARGRLYLGSFSKVLAPGCAWATWWRPQALYPKLLQAKQAADLHTRASTSAWCYEVMQGRLPRPHVPTIRARYKAAARCHAAAPAAPPAAGLPSGSRPQGGMFFWLRLPRAGRDGAAAAAVARRHRLRARRAFFAAGWTRQHAAPELRHRCRRRRSRQAWPRWAACCQPRSERARMKRTALRPARRLQRGAAAGNPLAVVHATPRA
jgi:hypothetical protein